MQEGAHPTSIVPVIITGLIHGPVWTLIVLEADCLCHQPGVPIIPRPRQDFTGVANCPRPARQVLYETILISYSSQFIYRVIKSIPSPGGIGLSLVLWWHRCWKLSMARKASTLWDRLDLIIHISYSSSGLKLGFFWLNMYFESWVIKRYPWRGE